MRTIPFWVAVITSVTLAAHADSFVMSVSGVTSNATKAYTNPVPVSGYIECVKITCDSALTGTVTVAGRDETVLIVATPAAGGTAVYHPMVQACWTNGTAFSASGNTNATRVYIMEGRG